MPSSDEQLQLSWIGDRYLRLALGDDMSLATHRRVRAAFERLRSSIVPGLVDLVPAYATILISFNLAGLDAAQAERDVMAVLEGFEAEVETNPQRVIEVPVCYEGECAPDLDGVSALLGITREEIVSLHSGGSYVVHFVGFSPGFPYLGGLSPRLSTARLERPRVRVPAGSIGIAGGQTGIYPQATPGGWRLIGRTPLRLFDARRAAPSLLTMGDTVRFVPIAPDRFREMAGVQTDNKTGGS